MSSLILEGKTILVTRARPQASKFAVLLESYGARVLLCPTIQIVPPKDFAPLDKSIANIAFYDWILFTSANGVEKFFQRFKELKGNIQAFSKLKTGAIGPFTQSKMFEYGMKVNFVSQDYAAESFLEGIPVQAGEKALIPCAAQAREVLPEGLKKRGVIVTVAEVYQSVSDSSKITELKDWVNQERLDCVTFTSSSTVRNFFSLLGVNEKKKLTQNSKVSAASIGPITTQTLLDYGWKPAIVANKPTTVHLSEAIVKFYGD